MPHELRVHCIIAFDKDVSGSVESQTISKHLFRFIIAASLLLYALLLECNSKYPYKKALTRGFLSSKKSSTEATEER